MRSTKRGRSVPEGGAPRTAPCRTFDSMAHARVPHRRAHHRTEHERGCRFQYVPALCAVRGRVRASARVHLLKQVDEVVLIAVDRGGERLQHGHLHQKVRRHAEEAKPRELLVCAESTRTVQGAPVRGARV
eukprot:3011549-Prymnesium_polylepis.2